LYKTTIKNITETKVQSNDNSSQNMVSITFETEHNGQTKTETVTLVGTGTLKSAALV